MKNIDEIYQDRINVLKKIDAPKIGWFSIYTPEEIIRAAGLIPFRITGENLGSTSKAKALMDSNICSYPLSCLEEGVEGVYDFMKGAVIVNECDARRRLYDAWRYYVNTEYIHFIDLPKVISSHSEEYFRRQIGLFSESLRNHFGCKITESSLREAIETYNETRCLLKKLSVLRAKKDSPITGMQFIDIVKASMLGLGKTFNEDLSGLIARLENQEEVKSRKRVRILLCGSYFDQTRLVEFIEQYGGLVVCEDLSNGIRYFEGNIEMEGDPLTAISNYYLRKATCARMIDSERRFQYISKLIDEYKVDAVIYFCLKFCDTNLIDFPYQKQKFDERGIPVLFLEGERTLINFEQLKTRIQAFLERKFLQI
jgi:benzoyl-CoA reductase/2-hydroxyglutaryl-CoA dehydratase subunit BcrC/BadD/HgdB